MSAPTSGSSGSSSSASPVPGYYPDPSIPNYIRYWNGSSWVPGTSRPAPGVDAAAQGAPVPAQGGPARERAVDESGPMFMDEDPAAPVAELGPAAPPVAPVWPAPAEPAAGLPRISWGTPAAREPAAPGPGAPGGPFTAQPQPQPQPDPRAVPPQAGPYGEPAPPVRPASPVRPAAPVQPTPPARSGGWAGRVQELARDEPVVPWRPPVADPFAGARQQERPGGLVRRFAARVIDTVVAAAVVGAAAVPLGTAAYHHAKDKVDRARLTGETVKVWLIDGTTGAQLGAVLVVAVLVGLLLEVLPTVKWGRTLGKKLVGLRVLDIEAQLPPAFGASLRRWLTRSVLDVLAVGVVGVAWCLFDRPWKQCWHDKAARTFVAGD
ncbi:MULTISPECIES: RDD family protein [unclassified Streptomyces]|uniref:RDD family protein n=1 Tax=unclassified Streptomyces TaxID=2593676 RepID=UPI002E2C3CA1|nr:RDD family protein [Streptomyces sp. NBC_00223]